MICPGVYAELARYEAPCCSSATIRTSCMGLTGRMTHRSFASSERSGSSSLCSLSKELICGPFFSRMEPSSARRSLITLDNLSRASGNEFSPTVDETYGLKRRTAE